MRKGLIRGMALVWIAAFLGLAITFSSVNQFANASMNASPTTVGTASVNVVPAGNGQYGWITNVGTAQAAYCNVGQTAATTSYDFIVQPNGGIWYLPKRAENPPLRVGASSILSDAINCITASSTTTMNYEKR